MGEQEVAAPEDHRAGRSAEPNGAGRAGLGSTGPGPSQGRATVIPAQRPAAGGGDDQNPARASASVSGGEAVSAQELAALPPRTANAKVYRSAGSPAATEPGPAPSPPAPAPPAPGPHPSEPDPGPRQPEPSQPPPTPPNPVPPAPAPAPPGPSPIPDPPAPPVPVPPDPMPPVPPAPAPPGPMPAPPFPPPPATAARPPFPPPPADATRPAFPPPPATATRPVDARATGSHPVVPAPRAGGSDPAYQGTVYGAGTDSPGYATIGFQAGFPAANPVENTGSLTGHILAQGWPDTPESSGGNNTKVLIVLAVALLVAVGVSAFVVFAAGDILDALFGNA